MLSSAFKDLKGGLSLAHVWLFQAYHDISAKYKRTILGPLWLAASMVFMSLSFSIVVGSLFGQDLRETLPYIMGGIMAFNLIGYAISEAPETYMSNSGIIKNHAYPFTYYTFEAVAKNVIMFFHNLVVFEIILAILGKMVIPHWSFILGLPVVVFNMFVWGSLISLLSSRYRDLRYLIPYLAGVLMFMTPIMYRVDQLQGGKLLIVHLNPIYPFVEMLRSPLLGGAMPVDYWPMAGIVSVVGFLLWMLFFSLFRKRIPFWV